MTIEEWREFLQRWSDEWLATDEKFSARVRKNRWLGSSPASEKQIAQLEKRLGYQLPPSYRNFLLVTNGWSRTSTFIEQLRPANKVEWLDIDNPQLIEAYSLDNDSGQYYSPEKYFLYDGTPIFERSHLEKCLIIADPVAGDSMMYLLNPEVVAEDGEWEAWRFANWIPGAERFPSFSLLMRSEHELFPKQKPGKNLIGPFTGAYAPDRPRHEAKRIGPGRAKPDRRTVRELIDLLESPNRATRLNAAKQLSREYGPHDPEDVHPEIVEPLSRILKADIELEVRHAAAAILGSYGDSSAIPPLLNTLDDPQLSGAAMSSLFYLSAENKDSQIADAVVRLLGSPQDYFVINHAIYILDELEDPRVASIGLRILDGDILMRISQTRTRSGLKNATNAHDPVSSFLDVPPDSQLRFQGAFAFAKFAPNAAKELVTRLSHPDAEIRAVSAAALRESKDKGLWLKEHLMPLLGDPDEAVRNQVKMTLRSLEPSPKVEISSEHAAQIAQQISSLVKQASKRKRRFI